MGEGLKGGDIEERGHGLGIIGEKEMVKAAAFHDYKVKDLSLATWGHKEIELAEAEMPGLMAIQKKYKGQRPLQGARIRQPSSLRPCRP